MKRRKRPQASPFVGQTMRRMQRQQTHLELCYEVARLSAETIGYRTAMLGQALAGAGSAAHNMEFLMMVTEKMLAGAQAGAIAARHIGPAQRVWTDWWFRQSQRRIAAWPPQQPAYAAEHLLRDWTSAWLRWAALFERAALSHTRPIHRTVAGNARRLRRAKA